MAQPDYLDAPGWYASPASGSQSAERDGEIWTGNTRPGEH